VTTAASSLGKDKAVQPHNVRVAANRMQKKNLLEPFYQVLRLDNASQ
jgi:hypothetical protein